MHSREHREQGGWSPVRSDPHQHRWGGQQFRLIAFIRNGLKRIAEQGGWSPGLTRTWEGSAVSRRQPVQQRSTACRSIQHSQNRSLQPLSSCVVTAVACMAAPTAASYVLQPPPKTNMNSQQNRFTDLLGSTHVQLLLAVLPPRNGCQPAGETGKRMHTCSAQLALVCMQVGAGLRIVPALTVWAWPRRVACWSECGSAHPAAGVVSLLTVKDSGN